MATLYSTEGAKQNDPTAKNLLNGDSAQSSVVYGKGSYTTTATLAAADVIRMFKIPEGYTPIVESFTLKTDGVGATTCTANLGTDLDPNAIISSNVDINTANNYFTAGDEGTSNVGVEALTPTITTADGWVTVTIVALTGTAGAGNVINVSGLFAKA
jgi:hypothetical protein